MLKGKVAIITGATSGIGGATAFEFARHGAVLLLTGRDEARGRNLQEELENQGHRANLQYGDICNSDFCETLVSECVRAFGRIDIVVNCAGIIYRADVTTTTNEQWDKTLSTNLTAPFYVSRAAMPALEATRGNIVNVASDWGLSGGSRAAAYCASKGGLVLMTRAMARDHAAQGVRINAVCPGDTQTPMLEREIAALNGNFEDLEAAIPMGRMAAPEDIAKSIRFLASDDASFITGVALLIDGGSSA